MGATRTIDNRAELISAAERLFATRGIDGVSLREINRSAGQKNNGALQYHFEGRAGLLQAILDKHKRDVEITRHALLEQFETGSRTDPRPLVGAFILPLAAKLHDTSGGPEFLRIAAELVNRPDGDPATPDRAESLYRWTALVEPFLPVGTVGAPLHRRLAAIRFVHVELGRRAMQIQRRNDQLFVSYLTDLTTSLLLGPVSSETQRLVKGRRQGQALTPRTTCHPGPRTDA